MNRTAVWMQALVALACYVAAIALTHRWFVGPRIEFVPIAIAIAFAVVQVAATFIALAIVFARRQRNVVRARRSERIGGEVTEAVALHSVGVDQTARILELQRRARRELRQAVLDTLAVTMGEPQARIAALAERLGIEGRSSDEEIDRARTYIRDGQYAAAIALAARASLLVRAIVTEELEPLAGALAERELIDALRSDDRAIAIAALDMLVAWKRNTRVPGFTLLLASSEPAVRSRALLALPYVAAGFEPNALADAIAAAARHDHAAVRRAAAVAAAQLGVTGVAGALARNIADEDDEVARASAFALAQLGAHEVLREAVAAGAARAAAFAFEAVEKAAVGRLEIA
ncbi:MAG: HEAT repeat domain-containing protein [Acidobacteriota bacterium]|nr:HEAT repeat domain-containing protein [Acidobacteriota bacterium]